MGQIKKKNIYPPDSVITDKDMLIGTDYNNLDKTKNYLMKDIKDYVIANIPGFDQNNLVPETSISLNNFASPIAVDTLIQNYLNTITLVVTEKQLPLYRFYVINDELDTTKNVTYIYLWGIGKGTYVHPLLTDFRKINTVLPSPEDIQSQPNTVTLELGVISILTTFVDIINNYPTPINFNDPLLIYLVTFTQDNEVFFYKFIGDNDIYGLGLAQCTIDDFSQIISNDIVDFSVFVPYAGATTDVDLGDFQLKAGQLELDQTPTGTFSTAKIRWNDTAGTAEIRLKGNNVTLQLGQELVKRVVNKTVSNITLQESNYQVVKIVGATGQRLSVDLAQANNELNSSSTLGLVTENIANNQEGFITFSGEVNSINTTGSLQGETWVDGDVLYLSPTVAGQLTKEEPTAPNHTVKVAMVQHAHITQGKLHVDIDTGYSIDNLHNVAITGTTANKVIGSTTEGLWENKTVAEILGYVPQAKLVAGENITIDETDPFNPVISTSGGGTTPTLQQVTEEGATTNVPTTFATTDPSEPAILASSVNPPAIVASSENSSGAIILSNNGIALQVISQASKAIICQSYDDIALTVNSDSDIGVLIISNSAQALVANIDSYSTSNIAEFRKNNVNQVSISHDGKIKATAGTESTDVVVKSQLDTKANQFGTVLYHSAKWFTPTGTVSSSGTTVTSVGTQFTSAMVGSKLIINGEERIIITYTSSTAVVVDSAYSINYSGVVAGDWGVYSIMFSVNDSLFTAIIRTAQGNPANITLDRVRASHYQGNAAARITTDVNGIFLGSDKFLNWSTLTNAADTATPDIGLKRNSAGVLEVFNGVTATTYRDLKLRKLNASSSVQVGDDTASASSTNVGSMRYREDANNSYVEMCVRTGASSYAWQIIIINTW